MYNHFRVRPVLIISQLSSMFLFLLAKYQVAIIVVAASFYSLGFVCYDYCAVAMGKLPLNLNLDLRL